MVFIKAAQISKSRFVPKQMFVDIFFMFDHLRNLSEVNGVVKL